MNTYPKTLRCKICNKESLNKKILSYHISYNHKDIGKLNYSIDYFHEGNRPVCKCGCGKYTRFERLGKFATYFLGHNVGLSDEVKKERQIQSEKLKQKRLSEGWIECKICNKVYIDNRVLSYHIVVSHKGEITKREYTLKYLYDNKVPLCKCGCDEETTYKYFGTFRIYISGHNARVDNPWTGGSGWTKEELSEIYYKRFKNGAWNNPRKHPLVEIKCIGCNVEFKVSASYKTQRYCSKKCYLTNTRTTRTIPENKVADILNENNINFIRNKKIGKYFIDFYLPELNLGLEVDGNFWHCNPLMFKPEYFHPVKKKTAKEIWKYDIDRHSNIVQSGIKLNRIWENDISKNNVLTLIN